eukprot:g23559.t1
MLLGTEWPKCDIATTMSLLWAHSIDAAAADGAGSRTGPKLASAATSMNFTGRRRCQEPEPASATALRENCGEDAEILQHDLVKL